MRNKGLETSPLYGASNILLHGPLGDIPEDAHAMVTQNGIGIDTLNVAVSNEHSIDVSKEGIGGSLRHSDLELLVALGTLVRIVGLTSLLQPLINFCIGVTGVVGTCVSGEYLVGVVISIVRLTIKSQVPI